VALINRLVKPLIGINLPNQQIELSAIYHDAVIGLIPQHHIDLRFETIRKKLDIPDLGAHDAFADALMVAIAYIKLNKS
jgi:DNA polymerase-3 subunit epsilon